MADRRRRDLDVVTRGLKAWASEKRDGATVVEVRRPSAGWSNDTLMVTMVGPDPEPFDVVIRLPNLIPAFPDTGPVREAAVLRLLAAYDLPVPKVLALETDGEWLGDPFVVISKLPGHVVGEAAALDPWITSSDESVQRGVQEELITSLSQVHRLTAAVGAGLDLRRGLLEELDYWDRFVQWAADSRPSGELVDALAWCREHRPIEAGPDVLQWGDARLGNMLFDGQRRVTGIIDWELASFGPREMDLGWYLAMEELTTRMVKASVPGFRDAADFVAAYEESSGHPVRDLDWHLIFALTRATAINDREARVAERTQERYPGTYGDGHPLLRAARRRMNGFVAT